MASTATRIAPLDPPYEPQIENTLRSLMGGVGAEALALFRTIARHEPLLERFRQTGSTLLSFGRLDAIDRETVIHRVCARCDAEYEWGVHAVVFAEGLGLDEHWLAATVRGAASDFEPRQSLLVALVDELHDTATISDELWAQLAATWSDEQLLELLALVGFYHLVAFICNGVRLPLEPWAARFPPQSAGLRSEA
jgi:alkylhydroperoxidase family enzyme